MPAHENPPAQHGAPAGPPAQQRTPGIKVSRRTVTIAVSAIVLVAVIVAVVALTTHSL